MKTTNTFENGLNKDVNVNLQPPGTYRDLHNGMLISYDGNHYVVETALGNQVNFTIPARYSDASFNKATPPLPIGMISFIDTLVVFSTNVRGTTGGYGEIGVVTFDNNGAGTYTPLYHSDFLKFTKFNKIHGFSYAENDKIQRVYWCDNLNDNRVLNIKDPLFTNVPSGSLIANTQYMVVGGAVEYPTGSGQYFGPGIPGNGNVFTATSGPNYTVADSLQAGYPKVYQYIDYHLLSWTPDRILGSIDFVKHLTGGSVNCGSKMYFYRMKLSNQDYVTPWSYGSFPINLPKTFATNWKDQQGGGAGQVVTNSAHGIEIQISNIDTKFDTIEVAVADFDAKNNVLTDAKIIISTSVTGPTMIFDHMGGENIQALSVNDLTIFPASLLHSKDMCTVKNYITIANLTERDEITFDTTGITISDITYDTPADVYGDNTTIIQQGSYFQSASGVPTNGILPDGRYVVGGGGGSVVTYNGNNYSIGQTFVGVAGVINWTVSAGAPVVNACIVIKKYTDSGSNPVNKVIPILDDYFDYKGMPATQYLRQYWTNETYRLGILFYDLKGNPYFVRWIGDHQIWNTPNTNPPVGITNKGGLIKDNGTGHDFSLRINGLSISGITIPPSLAALITGFSIVRAPRDRQYYAQGIIFPTVKDSGASKCRPMSEDRLANDNWYAANGGVSSVYTWHSPDALFGSTIFSPTGAGNELEGEFFPSPINAGVPFVQVGGGGDQYFTKFYEHGTSNPFNTPITTYSGVLPAGSYGQIIPGLDFENAFLEQAGFAPSPNHQSVGGNCSLIRTTNPILYGGKDLVDAANANLQQKALVNYKVPKGSLYGGSNPTAIANTPFISTGHFQEINPAVLATLPVVGGNYVFNDVMVFGGDSFVGVFDHAKCLFDANLTSYSYGIFIPVESNVNHYMREGRNLAKDGMQVNDPAPSNGIWYYGTDGTSQLEQFLVNDAYTSDGDPFEYPALPVNFVNTGLFPFRTRWNGPKISGESIDVFRVFPTNQFRDLDGRMGQINNIITKAGRLYAVQDDAVNYLPVLERQLVNGDLGAATQLGVGGVIDRFDVITSYFGNQHQNSMVETEYGFSWFDMRRRAWLVMSVGGDVQEISVTKGLQSFFNRVFEDQNINQNPIYTTDRPLIGVGIHGVYDPQFKTTFMTFKNFRTFEGSYTNYDFTVGYNHTRNVIVGFFDFNPAIWHSHNRYLLSAKNASASEVFAGHTYNMGDEVFLNGTEYIDVEPLTFTAHTPVQSWEKPDYPNSNIWTKLYSENEIYVHWKPSAGICKFYGRVYPLIHEVVITPNAGEPVSVDNLQVKSSIAVNYDTMEYFTDNDSGIDTKLNVGTNRNYRVRDNAWESNVPFGSNGRLVDYYLRVKMTLNNFTTNPTVANNVQKVTAFINSIWRIKR